MNRLYSIGELLIDFQSVGTKGLKDTEQFVKNAGGAPANVAAQAVKFGANATYLTKVGNDGFGDFLIESLSQVGIDTTHILKDKNYSTSLAFVSFQENGEREFSFYRSNAADLYFTPRDFKDVRFDSSDILEFGSVALKTSVSRETHDYLIEKAKKANALVAFDPNLRFNLWEDINELRRVVNDYLKVADIVKVGKDELEFITGKKDNAAIDEILINKTKMLLVTDGSKGATLYVNNKSYYCPGYKVKAIDTTGAGDSFFGAFLALLIKNKDGLDYQHLLNMACKAGAYTTTGYGAIKAMGDLDTIERTVK